MCALKLQPPQKNQLDKVAPLLQNVFQAIVFIVYAEAHQFIAGIATVILVKVAQVARVIAEHAQQQKKPMVNPVPILLL